MSSLLSSTGVLEVLQCILLESPEALNVIKESHIHSVIAFLDKHGLNHKVVMLHIISKCSDRNPDIFFPPLEINHPNSHSDAFSAL